MDSPFEIFINCTFFFSLFIEMLKNTVHYYKDGDILVSIQHTIFRLHRNFLDIASKVFEDMFFYAISTMIMTDNVSCLILTLQRSKILLIFLYPKNIYIRILGKWR